MAKREKWEFPVYFFITGVNATQTGFKMTIKRSFTAPNGYDPKGWQPGVRRTTGDIPLTEGTVRSFCWAAANGYA